MSRLRALKPIEIDRCTRERLWSYLVRLAEAHGLLVGDLIKGIIWPESGWADGKKRKLRGFEEFGHIDGAGRVAQEWVEVLQRLTGRKDLSRLTLLGASRVARFDGLLRNHGARCIECIREAVESRRPCYEQLSWAFTNSILCLKHSVLLVDHCQVCESDNLAIVRRDARICCCGSCGKWMGGPEFQSESETTTSRYNVAISEGVRDLLAILDDPKLQAVSGVAVLEYAAKIGFDGNFAAMARSIDMPKSTLSVILSQGTKPKFDTLLAVSMASGVPLKPLLLGSLTGRRLNVARFKKPVEVPTVLRERRPQLDIKAAQSELRAALRRDRAMSLAAVAGRLNVSPRVLSEHCRELCDEVVARYARHVHARSQARIAKNQKRLFAAFSTCVLAGEFPTVRRLSEVFGAQLRSQESQIFYHQTLNEYGLEGLGSAPEPLQVNALKRAERLLIQQNLQDAQQPQL